MNRIILIGNGFDLAHNLSTSYGNFIDWYWGKVKEQLKSNNKKSIDKLCKVENKSNCGNWIYLKHFISNIDDLSGRTLGQQLLNVRFKKTEFDVQICEFLKNICKSVETKGWVDIENEYYKLLVSCSKHEIFELNHQILNSQLDCLRNKLVEYLKIIPIESIKVNTKIKNIIYSSINPNDIAVSEREQLENHVKYWTTCDEQEYKDKMQLFKVNYLYHNEKTEFMLKGSKYDWDDIYRNYPSFCLPDNIMLLNFNYTNTANQYVQAHHPIFEINHIHGELSKPESIIFGYGDELDENYKKISNLNDNEYLANFKSIKYLESDRYRKALQFMDAAPYQVFIMGHSCGNSDRTFLNTLFEHKNCVSIKPYYYKNGEKDNYLEIVQNISRNFTDMKLMRDRVVNKTYCETFSEDV